MMRAASFLRAEALASGLARPKPAGVAQLPHDRRHLRRKLVELDGGGVVMVDFPKAVALGHGDVLVLDDGRHVEIRAAPKELLDVRARDARHLTELAWHIGNRHLPAAIEADRLLVQRDHVIKAMLEGLGADVTDVVEPFEPARGAYSGHGGHHHHESHGHHHD